MKIDFPHHLGGFSAALFHCPRYALRRFAPRVRITLPTRRVAVEAGWYCGEGWAVEVTLDRYGLFFKVGKFVVGVHLDI